MSSVYVLLLTTLRLAIRQLLRHKVRSLLTMLGILIGVGAVVAIVSLGEGLRGMFMGSIATQATADLIWIMPDVPMQPGHMPRGVKLFKNRDLDMVRTSDYVSEATGIHMIENTVIKHGWRSDRVHCVCAAPQYFAMERWELDRGRIYNDFEMRGRAMVCLVAYDVHEQLYEEQEEILDSFLQISGQRFKVIGTLKERSAMEGGSMANMMVFVPTTTGQSRLLGTDELFTITAKIKDSSKLAAAKEDIAARLRASRRIRSGKDDDFQISTAEDWADFANGFVNTLLMVFGIVAIIALAVGGIGVMNIMLVNVRERTKEIGLRKAIGATAAQITWQFLVEAMTLTIIGGLVGIGLGYALGFGVALLMKGLWGVFWMPSVPLAWIFTVIGTSAFLGLAFGVYPAWRAGVMDPINALHYE